MSRVTSNRSLNEATRRGEIAGRTNGQGSSVTDVERGKKRAGGCFVHLLLPAHAPFITADHLSPSVTIMRAIIISVRPAIEI